MTEQETQLYDQITSDVTTLIALRTAKITDATDAKRALIIAGVALETVAKAIDETVPTQTR